MHLSRDIETFKLCIWLPCLHSVPALVRISLGVERTFPALPGHLSCFRDQYASGGSLEKMWWGPRKGLNLWWILWGKHPENHSNANDSKDCWSSRIFTHFEVQKKVMCMYIYSIHLFMFMYYVHRCKTMGLKPHDQCNWWCLLAMVKKNRPKSG